MTHDDDVERVKEMIFAAYLDMDASDLAKRMNAGMSAREALRRSLNGIIPEVISAYRHAALSAMPDAAQVAETRVREMTHDETVERVARALAEEMDLDADDYYARKLARAALSAMPDAALLREALSALVEAHDCIASWGGYASSYFQEKHDLEGDLARARAAADKIRAALEHQQKGEPKP